jgi:aquaporin Z
MPKYIMEFIGTFFLVLVVALTGNPIAIGAVLMVMIYMGGNVSGGHFNPSVSLGVFLRGKMSGKDFVMYNIFQLIGAIAATLVYFSLSTRPFVPAPAPDVTFVKAIVAEAIFTFALVSVVLNTATTKKAAGNSYFGLAIGFTVLAGAFAVGPISGGAFNPAVGIGPNIVDIFRGGINYGMNILTYIIGPELGGILAAIVFRWTNPDEFE